MERPMTTAPQRLSERPGLFDTTYGGFREDGQAFIIRRPDTPRPWINILCNGSYGLTISQTGGGFSWWENANLARLTSWNQDLIRDDSGKYLYIRDDDTKEVWSASWKPVCAAYDHYEVQHGVGWTAFVQRARGIEVRWTLLVPPRDPVELWHVEVRNLGDTPRRLSLFTYLEWCLGNGMDWHREFQKTFIETAYRESLRALIGVKRKLPIPPYISTGMSEWPLSGFHAVNREVASYEGDKERFLGRYRSLSAPASVAQGQLSQTTGRWNDSVASLQVRLTLEPGRSEETVFLVGKYDSDEALETLLHAYASPEGVRRARQEIEKLWEPFLNRLRVETPDPAFNLLTNVWLKYQAIAGRMWAKTAYYQSSAAYGYRDQLQDSHIFLPLRPELTKRQILLHASQQFRDGVVRHWWFPLLDTGPRTGKTDDLLWLVFVTLSYVRETDDATILNETARFVDGGDGTLFDHCTRSIERVFARFSARGLPLLGEGDWNDGLSAAGAKWKGESLWMGHFLYTILVQWSDLLVRVKDERSIKLKGATGARLAGQIRRYRQRAAALKVAINRYGWDGTWYWYASRDDGKLIGSKTSPEGKIHLNAQTWSVIAGTATPERAKTAMASMERLLNREYGPLLLTPAYTRPDDNIGYLSRYAPGVRENGGVYSHGATWAILAECLMGRGDLAYEMYTKICPPRRGLDPELYYAEPYVMPGNTDGPESPTFGRAGWTWYTGAAAWLFRVSTEWILGVRPTRDGLLVDPCMPSSWDGFRLVRQFRGSTFQIAVENPAHVCRGVAELWLDGKRLAGAVLPDLRDGQVHQVRAVLGPRRRASTPKTRRRP